MFEKVTQPIKTLRERMRQRGSWLFVWWLLGGAAVLSLWLIFPNVREPYLRIPGSIYTQAISCIPSTVHMDMRAGYAQLKHAKIVLAGAGDTRSAATYDFAIAAAPNEPGFLLTLTSAHQSDAIAKLLELGSGADARIVAEFKRVPQIDIDAVSSTFSRHPKNPSCGPTQLRGEALAIQSRNPGQRLMYVTLPQDKVSDFLHLANEYVGAIALGCLILTLSWLIGQLIAGFHYLFLKSDDKIKEHLNAEVERRKGTTPNYQSSDFIEGDYDLRHRRLAFVRVLGPAVGFLLTVSSLVAGLHPSLQAAQDTFAFISSLQLALVATFLGLLIRIVAEFAIRVHSAASDRSSLLV